MLKVPDSITRVKPVRGLARLRYQLLVGLLLAVLLPTVLRGWLDSSIYLSAHGSTTTLFACALSLVIGISLFRRLAIYPGVRGFEFVLPSFAIAYGIVAVGLLMFRIDYVRSVLLSSLAISIVLFFFIYYRTQRQSTRLFAIVPYGRVDGLSALPGVDWTFLTEPRLPQQPITAIVADFHADLEDDWERLLADATLAGVPCFHVKQLRESLTGRVQLEHLSENSFGSLIPDHAYIKAKRIFDFVTALLALPVLTLLALFVGAAIKLDSPGPVFFTQKRMGYRGVPFTVIKFRTMKVQEPGEHCRDQAITQDADSRITKLGAFLRRTRIDELPQILNIVRGEMSWIGPRPEAIPLSLWYEGELPFYRYRHAVIPGITGWAQVNQGHVAELDDVYEKLCYDFYYLKNFSAGLDALIVFRTIQTVFTGHGSR